MKAETMKAAIFSFHNSAFISRRILIRVHGSCSTKANFLVQLSEFSLQFGEAFSAG
jgi:hypothetical protein